MKTSVINQIKTLLGMEIKLEMMKMADGVTVIEADKFEMDNEVFVVTPDEQKIPVPVGEYELENGMILIVEVEGIIADVKEASMEEEVAPAESTTPEVPVEATTEEVSTPKKTIESVVKETFFSELEELKNENIELKAQLEKLSAVETTNNDVVELAEEVKPIAFNPENETKVEMFKIATKRNRSIMDSILEKINK
jgi:hypothetical protein